MTTAIREQKVIYTTVFTQLNQAWEDGKRRFFIDGGTSSSKTYSIMQFLIMLLANYPKPILATVTSESLPHLKRGAMKDFLAIMGDDLILSCWNKSDFVYTFPKSGCRLEYVSDDQPEKWTGGRREIHFWNELNNIHKMSYMEGDIRTSLFTIADWNPYGEFWFHDEKIAEEPGNVYLGGLTYHDTPEVVSEGIIQTIESYKDKDPNYYRVHALGLLGQIEGLVHPYFEQVDELPMGAVFYGLDYGFAKDPTVLVKNVIIGEKLYSQEMFYDDSGLTNDDIARRMSLCGVKGEEPIWADRNELKSAEELTRLGFNVLAIDKAYANVAFGTKKVNSYKQHWTRDSLNCIKEQRNFRYIEDKSHPGMFTERTTHQWSHGMCLAADTLIKTKRGDIPIKDVVTDDLVITSDGMQKVLDAWMTSPDAEVRTVTFSNGKSLTGTAEHPVWVEGKGYIGLQNLGAGDIIKVCQGERRLSTMERVITDTLMPLIGQTGCITEKFACVPIQKRTDTFTAKSGLITTEKFLKGVRYITKMMMSLITLSQIWNVDQRLGITSIIQPLTLSGSGSGSELMLRNIDTLPMITGEVMKAGSNSVKREYHLGKEERLHLLSAKNAGSHILRDNQTLKPDGFVQVDVNKHIGGKLARITLKSFVAGVVRLFRRIGTEKHNVVPVYVLHVSEPHRQKQAVFDLTIDKSHNFYANEVLVHNSARRFALSPHIDRVGGSNNIVVVGW